jgi:hypothetical protein
MEDNLHFILMNLHTLMCFEKYLPIVGIKESKTDSIILDALLEYEQRGYYRIENNIVSITERGLAECQKSVHDWE